MMCLDHSTVLILRHKTENWTAMAGPDLNERSNREQTRPEVKAS